MSPRYNPVIAECHLVLVSPLMTSNQLRPATAVVSRRFTGGSRLQTPAPRFLAMKVGPTGDQYENRKICCHSMYNPKEQDGSEILIMALYSVSDDGTSANGHPSSTPLLLNRCTLMLAPRRNAQTIKDTAFGTFISEGTVACKPSQ